MILYPSRYSIIASFGRGPDRKPRRKRLNQIGSVGLKAANAGLATASTLSLVGLLARPNNAALQGRLARAGLLAGAGYGAYQGIKAVRKKKRLFSINK